MDFFIFFYSKYFYSFIKFLFYSFLFVLLLLFKKTTTKLNWFFSKNKVWFINNYYYVYMYWILFRPAFGKLNEKKNHRKSFSCKNNFFARLQVLISICNFIICDQRKILSLSSGLSLKCAHFNVAMLSVFKESVYYLL